MIYFPVAFYLNEKLPSKRSLSTHLGVSVVTVMSAYELLVSEGYLYTKPKSGYFVVPIKTQQKVTNFQLSELVLRSLHHGLF